MIDTSLCSRVADPRSPGGTGGALLDARSSPHMSWPIIDDSVDRLVLVNTAGTPISRGLAIRLLQQNRHVLVSFGSFTFQKYN